MVTKTALIAIQDPSIERMLEAECLDRGWNVEKASADMFSVMTLITPVTPDVLLLDVDGAGGPALPLCEILAGEERFSGMPVILLVADSELEVAKQAQSLGVHAIEAGPDCRREVGTLLGQLPVAQGDGVECCADSEDSGGASGPKVLLIDDDPQYVRALQIQLTARGINVSYAFDGTQGFWRAVRDRPDVIVTDYTMPEGYGDYLIGRMQRHPATQKIPVVVVTGRKSGGLMDYSIQRDLLGAGAHAVLSKPVDFNRLLEELEKHFHEREAVGSGAA